MRQVWPALSFAKHSVISVKIAAARKARRTCQAQLLRLYDPKGKSEESRRSPTFPILGYIRRGLHTHSQGAQKTVLRRIDYDSHVTAPDHQIPGIWLQNTLESFYSTVKSAGGRVRVMQAHLLIQCVDQV
jgi:hypothetical protein